MKFVLECDGFHPNVEVNYLQAVKELVNEFPNILINLFTIPCYKGTPLYESRDWCKDVRTLIRSNNIRIAVHGTYSTKEEYKYYDYKTAVDKLKLGESILHAAGIDFVKVFKGCDWGLCEQSVDALCDLGYTHIYSHQSHSALNEYIKSKGIQTPIYNLDLTDVYGTFETLPISSTFIVHGHTSTDHKTWTDETIIRIKEFIKAYNPIFLGVDEYYE